MAAAVQWFVWFLFAYVIVQAGLQIAISLVAYGIIRQDMRLRRIEAKEFLLTGLEPRSASSWRPSTRN